MKKAEFSYVIIFWWNISRRWKKARIYETFKARFT